MSKTKKILFLDRDGTIIIEPEDYQIDSFEKLEFYPHVLKYLSKIAEETDYDLVMITNQDGLGTDSFPEDTFWPAHNKMLQILESEGITFSEVIIDKTFAKDKAPTRKPGTALLTSYIDGDYDLENSIVVGDRLTDIELAKNLGAKGILINGQGVGDDEIKSKAEDLKAVTALKTDNWKDIYSYLVNNTRFANVERGTKETKISVSVNLDGTGKTEISTGIGFYDHMLEQIGRHGGFDLTVKAEGDLHIDEHHTIEDVAITIGECFKKVLGDKRGIERYGHYMLPMDDCLCQVALDFGGRPQLVWGLEFEREAIGEMPTEMFEHFFKSFSDHAMCNLNIKAEGENEHHKIEGVFKAFARAIKMAVKKDIKNTHLPSTKGVL